jgi:hypothetical protein
VAKDKIERDFRGLECFKFGTLTIMFLVRNFSLSSRNTSNLQPQFPSSKENERDRERERERERDGVRGVWGREGTIP